MESFFGFFNGGFSTLQNKSPSRTGFENKTEGNGDEPYDEEVGEHESAETVGDEKDHFLPAGLDR